MTDASCEARLTTGAAGASAFAMQDLGIVEIMKTRGFLLASQPDHVAVRTAEEHCRLLRNAGLTGGIGASAH